MSADFRRFWNARGGAAAFERWRNGAPVPCLLVQVVAPHFVAGFVISDEVIEAAPILRRALMWKTEAQARAVIAANGWSASVVR